MTETSQIVTDSVRKLHVVLLSAEYPPQPGGIGDYTQHLGEALVARGNRVQVLTIADCRLQIADLTKSRITHHASRITYHASRITHHASWNFRSWHAVSTALAATRPDVLHIQYQTGAYGMHPAINLLPWWLRRSPQRPAVAVTMHDLLLPYLFPKAGPLRRWVTRRLMRDADAVVLTNEEDYATTRRWTTDGRRWITHGEQSSIVHRPSSALIPIGSNIAVAPPNGYDRAAWRAQLGAGAGETLVAYFGLLSRSKGLDVLLRALAQLPPSARLLLVGGAATTPQDRAYAAEIEELIGMLGLGKRVIRTGHCAPAEVSAHLLAADVAALPFADGASFRRGSLLAALAHGVPVVTTRPVEPRTKNQEPTNAGSVLGSRFSVLHESVLLVPPNDPAALAAALRRLIGDAALRERLGTAGQVLAAQFRWEAIAEQHEALYRRMLERH